MTTNWYEILIQFKSGRRKRWRTCRITPMNMAFLTFLTIDDCQIDIDKNNIEWSSIKLTSSTFTTTMTVEVSHD